MTSKNTLERVSQICRMVFDNPDLHISLETSARDVANWDSLNHVALIMELERSFDIKFALGELQDLKNIASLIQLIENKAS
jgi:acyl carrier protein